MTFLPIVARELRVAARRRGAFWTRLIAATVATLLGGWTLWWTSDANTPSSVGRAMFDQLTGLAFLFCLVAGPLFTADVVSEEKREGTLGLLFLTDLRGYDVVFGKLAAASVTAFFSLWATLPVLAIPLLLGGVSLAEFGRVALVLGNTLFFSLAAGMLVSACSRQARSAFAMTVLVIFLFAAVLPWLEESLRGPARMEPFRFLLALSPEQAFWAAKSPPGPRARLGFWLPLLGIHLLAWNFLAWSSWVVPRVWSETLALGPVRRWRANWQVWSFGDAAERSALRARLLARNPILWLGSRHRLKRLVLWWFFGVSLIAWLGLSLFWGRDSWSWAVTLFVAAFFQTPLKWLMASEATHRWIEDRQSGALELLLTTPLSVRDLLAGHMRALRRLFAPPVAALIGVELLSLFIGRKDSRLEIEAGYFALAVLVVFVWDVHTLAWVGAWLGLVKRKPNRAFLGALWRVLVVPWLIFIFFVFAGQPTGSGVALAWLLACGGTNVVLYLLARDNLMSYFRETAAEQYGGPSPQSA